MSDSAAALARFLVTVERRLHREIDATPVAEPARTLLDAGGKRLRARLLWWSGCAATAGVPHADGEHLVRAAAAIELAHLGSLVHDDVVDGGEHRRGAPTVHRRHGVRAATDAGAALAHLASEMVAPLGRPARRAVRRALLATCRGQIRELASPFVPLTARRRVAIMQEKTGAFIELAAALGAIVCRAPAPAHVAVCRFARRFGVAFQIADDLLDLVGDPRELGRANGADLCDGVLTLPVLLALEHEPSVAVALARINRSSDAATLAEAAAAIAVAGGVAGARAAAWSWLDRAIDALRPLAAGPAVAALSALARASVERGTRLAEPRFDGSPSADTASPTLRTALATASLRDPEAVLGARLSSLLEWFHPGLAGLVAVRCVAPRIASHRRELASLLRRSGTSTPDARTAADAVALAHALADHDALRRDPVTTLACVDALHCAAIALLSGGATPHEQALVSARARHLVGRSAADHATVSTAFAAPAGAIPTTTLAPPA
jgi:heptaprenyl diphosphate synthase